MSPTTTTNSILLERPTAHTFTYPKFDIKLRLCLIVESPFEQHAAVRVVPDFSDQLPGNCDQMYRGSSQKNLRHGLRVNKNACGCNILLSLEPVWTGVTRLLVKQQTARDEGTSACRGANPRSGLSRIARFDALTLRSHTRYSSNTIIFIAKHPPHVTDSNVALLRYSSMHSFFVLFCVFTHTSWPPAAA